MKDPAILFYPGDWLGGTMLMNRHHKGAYMDVLMAQYNNGHLALQQIKTLLGPADENLWDEVLKFKFEQDEKGKFFNKRLEFEILKRRAFTESRKNNLKKKGETTSHKGSHKENHKARLMENENENENINRNINKDLNENRKKKKEDFLTKIVNIFTEEHGDYIPVNMGKERMMAAKLLTIYKKINPTADSDTALYDLRAYFKCCLKIKDNWMRNNMSLSLIVSKFNEINKIIKNEGNQAYRGVGATNEEITNLLAEKFGIK